MCSFRPKKDFLFSKIWKIKGENFSSRKKILFQKKNSDFCFSRIFFGFLRFGSPADRQVIVDLFVLLDRTSFQQFFAWKRKFSSFFDEISKSFAFFNLNIFGKDESDRRRSKVKFSESILSFYFQANWSSWWFDRLRGWFRFCSVCIDWNGSMPLQWKTRSAKDECRCFIEFLRKSDQVDDEILTVNKSIRSSVFKIVIRR